jgi:hypothetical protein
LQLIHVQKISNSFPPILPNLSGLQQNIGQPLLNVIGNNLGMNLLPPGQVLLPEQSGIAMSQNSVQCIPVQNEPSHANTFINVEGTNQNIQGVTSGVNICEGLQTKGITMTQVTFNNGCPIFCCKPDKFGRMGGKLLDMFDTTGTLFPILIVSVETRGGGTDSADFEFMFNTAVELDLSVLEIR